MTTATGEAKGLKQVLEEWGFDVQKLKAECMPIYPIENEGCYMALSHLVCVMNENMKFIKQPWKPWLLLGTNSLYWTLEIKMTTYQFNEISYSLEWKITKSFKSSHSTQSQCRLLQFKLFRSSSPLEINEISIVWSKSCTKYNFMEISKWNFKIQTPDNVQQEFWVVLHFHFYQLLPIAPATSAVSLKFCHERSFLII